MQDSTNVKAMGTPLWSFLPLFNTTKLSSYCKKKKETKAKATLPKKKSLFHVHLQKENVTFFTFFFP